MADRDHKAEGAIVERRDESSGKSLGLRFVEGTVRDFGRHVNVSAVFEVVARNQAHGLGVRNVGRTIKCPSKISQFPRERQWRRSFGRWLLAPPLLTPPAGMIIVLRRRGRIRVLPARLPASVSP